MRSSGLRIRLSKVASVQVVETEKKEPAKPCKGELNNQMEEYHTIAPGDLQPQTMESITPFGACESVDK